MKPSFFSVFAKTLSVLFLVLVGLSSYTMSAQASEKQDATLPVKTMVVDSTAYTSSVDECDADPWITADGYDLRDGGDGVIATNVLPFGTKVRIPALFGDKVFTVHDRMNKRYTYRVDVWMETKSQARKYGLHKNVTIEVVEMGDGVTVYAKRAAARREALAKAKAEQAKQVAVANVK